MLSVHATVLSMVGYHPWQEGNFKTEMMMRCGILHCIMTVVDEYITSALYVCTALLLMQESQHMTCRSFYTVCTHLIPVKERVPAQC